MKKNYKLLLLTLFLTIFGLWLLRPFYTKSITISFTATGDKTITFDVLWTDKAHPILDGSLIQKQVVHLTSAPQKVLFALPSKNLIKFRLDFGPNPGQVAISDLRITGKNQLNIEDFSIFDHIYIDSFIYSNNSLTIVSSQEDPFMVYRPEVNARGYTDYRLLFVLFLLLFLTLYKPVEYLAQLKSIHKQSRVNIVFVSIFFIFLFIPFILRSDKTVSVQENRNLAKCPRLLFEAHGLNYQYGREFEKCFEDHFFARDFIFSSLSKLKFLFHIPFENSVAYMGREQWMFPKIIIYKKYSEELLLQYAKKLLKLQTYTKEHNMKLVVAFAPGKEKIDPEYNTKKIDFSLDPVLQLMRLPELQGLDMVYLHHKISAHKNENLTFFKQDNHWTQFGAYWAYAELVEYLQATYPSLTVAPLKDFDSYTDKRVNYEFIDYFFQGGLASLLGLGKEVQTTPYTYYQNKHQNELRVEVDKIHWKKEFYNPSAPNVSIFVLGGSMGEQIMHFIPYSFRRSMRMRSNYGPYFTANQMQMSRFEKDIETFKPDILLVLVLSSSFFYIDTMY